MKPQITYFEMAAIPLFFGFAVDRKAYDREMKRLEVSNPPKFVMEGKPATTHHFTRVDAQSLKGATSIVCIDLAACKGMYACQVYGLVVHEATHVWQEACEYMGEVRPGREMEAYHVQRYTQDMLHELIGKVKWKR